jgi:hypothetical protein
MARKIILREDGLSGSPNTPSGYKFIGDSEGSISEKVGATVSAIGGSGGVQPLRYKALLTQNDEDAPVATVLENTLGLVLWEYVSVGNYKFLLSDILINKTIHLIQDNYADTSYTAQTFVPSNGTFEITSFLSSVLSDGVLFGTPILIEVYP